MGVVLPHSMGLGGGCLINYYDASTKKATVFDGRETAPLNARADMFHGDPSLARLGPLSVAVPGELRAYWEAHQKYGRLAWKTLFDGAVKIAEEGFRVNDHLANALKVSENIVKTSSLRHFFINPATNEIYKKDEILKRELLAKTLRKLSTSSPKFFYNGKMMKIIVDELRNFGSIITRKDFKSYKVSVYDALTTQLDDMLIYGTMPPGSGVLFAFILKLMSQFKQLFSNAKNNFEQAVLYNHLLVEVFKHTFSRRALLGDRKFDDISEVMRNLTSNEYLKFVKSRIVENRTFEPSYYGDVFMKDDHGTAHVSVIDQFGNAAAVSTTINRYFGSSIVSPSTGILFNNEMDDFSSPNITNEFGVVPTRLNRIAPGKRPMSSMCPSILVNVKSRLPILVVGGAGGTQITTGVASVALRTLLFDDTIKSAIDAPRLHHQLLPDVITYEHNFPQNIIKNLEEIGHKSKMLVGRSSVIVGIHRNQNGKITANSDYRKGGSISGF
ncbi:gamma-glutamyltranspeptidase 1-like isoform X2 [Dinothrombium tinctorium]|uniref:Gamma-glutamyltranspeptidase 1-like isoform X2 n=1 Tax=Dinothrombium tinctorium TaxID=1965070 RepID=A0A3S3NZ14_9ACAR|nr:gamma-glutamyltranspeptidase 1-like isoform X2 [Dinothrombium tinctorium]